MNKILNLLVPKEKKFFKLFTHAAENLVDASNQLLLMMREKDISKWPEHRTVISDLEHKGDEFTHLILNELSVSFITPFDREDIHSLAVVMDDILDYIHGSASRMVIYKIDTTTTEMIDLANLIQKSCMALQKAISSLDNLNKTEAINFAYVEVNKIENDADDIFDGALGRLFEEETNPIRLIKYKEIYMALETATDMAEDAADLIKSIQVKNA